MNNGYVPCLCIEEDTKLINPEYVRKAKIDVMKQVEKNKFFAWTKNTTISKGKLPNIQF